MPTLTEIMRREQPPGTDAEVAAWLAVTVTVDAPDAVLTYRDLVDRVGLPAVEAIETALASRPNWQWVRAALAGSGVDFSSTQIRNAVQGIRASLGDTITDSLLAVGVSSVPRWASLGLASRPTEADVAAARVNLTVDAFPLQSVLLSVSTQPVLGQAQGQASLSCRITPCALAANGEVLNGAPVVIAFSGLVQPMNAKQKALLLAIRNALTAYQA